LLRQTPLRAGRSHIQPQRLAQDRVDPRLPAGPALAQPRQHIRIEPYVDLLPRHGSLWTAGAVTHKLAALEYFRLRHHGVS